ncbi:MAG: ABC transporter substrate-binding protein [Nitrospira sp.]|nr:ABC transporter substrate-binding protein [Nitrospira sp.]
MADGSTNRSWVARAGGKALCGAMFCLSMLLGVPAPGQTAQTPVDAVHTTVDEVLYLLTELKETSRAGQRQWEIEQVVRRAFHYEAMAERALGDMGAQATPADRRQFMRLFVQVLRDDVIDRLRDYAVDQVVYLAEENDADGVQVLLAPAGLAIQTRMAFHVVMRNGRWLVDDVSIDGASIVANYQTQFTRILREGSFSDLMDYLKTKTPVA